MMGSELRFSGVDRQHSPRRPQTFSDPNVIRRAPPYDVSSQAEILMNTQKKQQNEQLQRFAGLGVGLASVLAENVLSHPCIVLRRQCQVHHQSMNYHLTPFTLVPVIWRIQTSQSMTCLWKGIGSVFIVRGIGLASEGVLAEFTPFPKEVSRHSSLKKMAQHLLLKGLSLIITVPFAAASLVETVQSDIASERPGIFDCLKEGLARLVGVGTPHTTRILPIWKLVVPSVFLGLTHYITMAIAQYTALHTMKTEKEEEMDPRHEDQLQHAQRSIYETYFPELLASFTANLVADVMLFPLETMVNRLFMQGTRTIIDNTDNGLEVVPITTAYDGLFDCFKHIVKEEGFFGFYKGFGALCLQYMLHATILKLSSILLENIAGHSPNPQPKSRPEDPNRYQELGAGEVPGAQRSASPRY
ncbi:solute carrier family 25 member 46 [Lingula anatina]|uniref:Solute carrier family 25 member 46 n=1 Tax=Lingula anatina TaxID=7574 RepID=A0A1S3J8Z2_LINAN|nr:solute carrier family 25 member 46 [Lingula anatina]|eukprot:XP_013406865.1 solute carrier family 25 member 46 [Lingula anatina]